MKIVIVEFNKGSTSSIDEFSDLIQKIINENNDLIEFRPYENQHTGNIRVELLFGEAKTLSSEVMSYGPGLMPDLLQQLNDTLKIASQQVKQVKFAGFVAMSKSPRSVGFLVLEKGEHNKGLTSAQVNKAEERSQNKAPNDRPTRKRKSAE